MKDIEWQVSNLELSKRLKELNCKQESIFVWGINQEDEYALCIKGSSDWEYLKNKPYYSAFTVAEFGEILPFGMKTLHIDTRLSYKYSKLKGGNWLCNNMVGSKKKLIYANTEANARAKMVIYLVENKLLKI